MRENLRSKMSRILLKHPLELSQMLSCANSAVFRSKIRFSARTMRIKVKEYATSKQCSIKETESGLAPSPQDAGKTRHS